MKLNPLAFHLASSLVLVCSHRSAAAVSPSHQARAVLENELAQKSNQDFKIWKQNRRAKEATTTIDVYYHIFINNSTDGDDVDDAILEKQTAILDEAYSGKANTFYPTDCDGNPIPDGIDTSFRFRFAGVTRTEDSVDGVQKGIDSVTDEEALAMLLDSEPTLFKALQGFNMTLYEEAESTVLEFKNKTRQEQLYDVILPLDPFRVLLTLYGGTQRVGDCSTLNVYIVSGTIIGNTLFGVATKPHLCAEGGALLTEDGVLLHRGALPDSDFPAGNPNDLSQSAYDVAERGDTLVHEVGHWLNLDHPDSAIDSPSTGRTGCDHLTGDWVADTPAAGMDSSSYCAAMLGLEATEPCCPKGADTCPHKEGEDPVTNFMSYSSDCCTNSFTEGQIMRMKHSWEAYRASSSDGVYDAVVDTITASTDGTISAGENDTEADPVTYSNDMAGNGTEVNVLSSSAVIVMHYFGTGMGFIGMVFLSGVFLS